jgi:hypothetical protein
LSRIATWFLTQETRQGNNPAPALTLPQVQVLIAGLLNQHLGCQRPTQLPRTMNR